MEDYGEGIGIFFGVIGLIVGGILIGFWGCVIGGVIGVIMGVNHDM